MQSIVIQNGRLFKQTNMGCMQEESHEEETNTPTNKQTNKQRQQQQQEIYTYRLHGVNQVCPPVSLLVKFGWLENKLLQTFMIVITKITFMQTVLKNVSKTDKNLNSPNSE